MTQSAPRPAARTDLPAILAIYNASIPAHMSTADLDPQSMTAREVWWEQRNHETRPVLVTEVEGKVVAWGAFTNFKDRAGYAPTAEVSVYGIAVFNTAAAGVGRRWEGAECCTVRLQHLIGRR